MYNEFFGLQKLPFNLTPDPAFLFLPSKHREALAGLTYAILDKKGFVVLTGDAGTGKTTLLASVLNRLPSDRVYSSIVLNPTLTPSEFLENVLLDFDITDVPASKAQRLWKLQTFLAETHHQGKVAVLVIDEAHKLSVELLEEIRLLGNFENAEHKFLQILLLGQCELDELLNRQDLRQFKQRIALRLYIDRLTPSGVEEYIRFRWAKSGGTGGVPFTPEALTGVVQWSRGIPRLINSICDTALLMAYGEGSRRVGMNYVREAATNLALVDGPEPAYIPPATVAGPVPVEKAATAAQGPSSLTLAMFETPTPSNGHAKPPEPFIPQKGPHIPTMAPYGPSKANSSFLKRLAERIGLRPADTRDAGVAGR